MKKEEPWLSRRFRLCQKLLAGSCLNRQGCRAGYVSDLARRVGRAAIADNDFADNPLHSRVEEGLKNSRQGQPRH